MKQLSPAQKAHVLQWLDAKGKDASSCPICEHNEWTMGITYGVGSQNALKIDLVEKEYEIQLDELMVLTCSECGYTMLFNTKTIGLKDWE